MLNVKGGVLLRQARIVKGLGEEAYLELEAGDDYLANNPDNVDEINEWIRIRGERHQANLRCAIYTSWLRN